LRCMATAESCCGSEFLNTESELITNRIAWFSCSFPPRNATVRIFYFLPPHWDKVLFVLHGIYRDATKYLKHWLVTAAERGIAVLAPEFSESSFPEDDYASGGVFSPGPSGMIRDRSEWSFAVIELTFDAFLAHIGILQPPTSYFIYGHSAGAQFVHRSLCTKRAVPVQFDTPSLSALTNRQRLHCDCETDSM
jgi:poly(3-hydroxybutyrate) depolymerase